MNEENNISECTEQTVRPNYKQNQREFSVSESVFAWFCLFAGYAFFRALPVTYYPLGGFLFVLILFCVTVAVLKIKGIKFSVLPTVFAVSAIITAAAPMIGANSFICFLSYAYSLAVYCYFVYALTGNSVKSGFNNYIFLDFFKALFLFPFHSFEKIFKALLLGKFKGNRKLVLKLFLGAVIAFFPTVIVLVLLSYDSLFSELWGKIFDFDFYNIFSHLVSAVLGIPLGMYIFGLFVSSVDKSCKDKLSAESCAKSVGKIKLVPVATMITACIPLPVIYIIFFISQWQYYISGFTGVLPKDFSYAQYAREGFFQLCAVAVINLSVVMFAVIFMKADKGQSAVLKVITLIYSIFTLVLISTAIAKMVMYINCYGLTQKRVYVTWFMICLTVIFILLILHQFFKKINTAALSLAICAVLFMVLSVSNVDGLIAKYNVDRYIGGTLETVDIDDMEYNLGDSAVPELVRLEKHLEKNGVKDIDDEKDKTLILYNQVSYCLDDEQEYLTQSEKSIFSFSFSSYKAKKSLDER